MGWGWRLSFLPPKQSLVLLGQHAALRASFSRAIPVRGGAPLSRLFAYSGISDFYKRWMNIIKSISRKMPTSTAEHRGTTKPSLKSLYFQKRAPGESTAGCYPLHNSFPQRATGTSAYGLPRLLMGRWQAQPWAASQGQCCSSLALWPWVSPLTSLSLSPHFINRKLSPHLLHHLTRMKWEKMPGRKRYMGMQTWFHSQLQLSKPHKGEAHKS